jgi:hypothetical protein
VLDELAEGRRALVACEWEEARAVFASVLRLEEQPEAHDGFGLASWFLGQIEEGLEARPASAPPLWGSEEHVRKLFAAADVELEFERATTPFRFDSAEHYASFFETNYGPTVKARERLTSQGDWEECRAEIVRMMERRNVATDGSLDVPSEYLVAVARKRG